MVHLGFVCTRFQGMAIKPLPGSYGCLFANFEVHGLRNSARTPRNLTSFSCELRSRISRDVCSNGGFLKPSVLNSSVGTTRGLHRIARNCRDTFGKFAVFIQRVDPFSGVESGGTPPPAFRLRGSRYAHFPGARGDCAERQRRIKQVKGYAAFLVILASVTAIGTPIYLNAIYSRQLQEFKPEA